MTAPVWFHQLSYLVAISHYLLFVILVSVVMPAILVLACLHLLDASRHSGSQNFGHGRSLAEAGYVAASFWGLIGFILLTLDLGLSFALHIMELISWCLFYYVCIS